MSLKKCGTGKTLKAELLNVLFSQDNLKLLDVINEYGPGSVSVLAALVEREQSNVSRSLKLLEEYGLVELVRTKGPAKKPVLATQRIVIDISM